MPKKKYTRGARYALLEQIPELRYERVDVLGAVRHELRLDTKRESLAIDLKDEIHDSRAARWRRKVAGRAARIGEAHRAMMADLKKREPQRERLGPGRWSYTAIDDAGKRVLVAEMRCDVPRGFADPTPVRIMIQAPSLMMDGKLVLVALASTAAA